MLVLFRTELLSWNSDFTTSHTIDSRPGAHMPREFVKSRVSASSASSLEEIA